MLKVSKKHTKLVQAVLASTLYIAPIAGHADETIFTSEVGPFTTAASGDITVTQTGQLAIAANSPSTVLTYNTPNATVVLLEGNNYFRRTASILDPRGTIQPDFGVAVNIQQSHATLNLGPVTNLAVGRGAYAAAPDGIIISGTDATILNAGAILSQNFSPNTVFNDNVIHVISGGDNASISNHNTGVIAGRGDLKSNVILVDAGTSAFHLDNQGIIEITGNFNDFAQVIIDNSQRPIEINGQFNRLLNSGYIIQNGRNTAPNIGNVPIIGEAILLNTDAQSGSLVNTETGTISVLTPNNTNPNTNTITVSGPINDLINRGFIENLTPDGGGAGVGGAIFLDTDAALNSIQNSGRVYSQETANATPVIFAKEAGATIFNGLTNSGAIINATAGNIAIDFSKLSAVTVENSGAVVGNILLASSGNSGSAPVFINTAGAVAGRVFGEETGGDTFNVSGGTVVSIETTDGSPVSPNTYNISGGHITDYLKCPSDINNTVVNLSGGHVGHIVGGKSANDIYNVSGGSFYILEGTGVPGPDQGAPGTSTLNILETFTADGLILDMAIVHVQNAGTVFTANNVITGVRANTFTIDSGTTFIPNSVVSALPGEQAIVNNNGTILVNSDSAVFDFSDSSKNTNPFTSVINNNNGGLVKINPAGVLRILGNNIGKDQPGNPLFVGHSGSTLNFQINGICCEEIPYGKMIVDSFSDDDFAVQLQTGSYVQPQFQGFLPRNSQFDVVTVHTGGNANAVTIQNNATLIPYPSALVYFTMDTFAEGTGASPSPEYNSILRLTSHRNTFASMSSTQVTTEIANTLDVFADSGCPPTNDFCRLLSAFDQIPTPEGVEDGMQSLIPPFNYGLIAASHVGMDNVFEAVTDRVFELAWDCMHNQIRFPARVGFDKKVQPVKQITKQTTKAQKKVQTTQSTPIQESPGTQIALSGMTAGDDLHPFSFWLRPIGAEINQNERHGVQGYFAKAGGVAIGVESGINDCTMYGLALSFTNVNVLDNAFAPKNETVKSWQGTVYGAYDFCYGIFMDAICGVARNQYKLNRVIHVHDLITAAQSSFHGTQWGAQGDIGINVPNTWGIFLAPFARLQYISINFEDYVETGAGDLSLEVKNSRATEFYGGIGFKAAKQLCLGNMEWIPEFSTMIATDFRNDAEDTVAAFLGGGVPFSTHGITPGNGIWNVGLSLHGVCGPSVISFKYNLDVRNQYVGSSAYLQAYYNW